jgi:hypothetical protein
MIEAVIVVVVVVIVVVIRSSYIVIHSVSGSWNFNYSIILAPTVLAKILIFNGTKSYETNKKNTV